MTDLASKMAQMMSECFNAMVVLAAPRVLALVEKDAPIDVIHEQIADNIETFASTARQLGDRISGPVDFDTLLSMVDELALALREADMTPEGAVVRRTLARSCLATMGAPEPDGGWDSFEAQVQTSESSAEPMDVEQALEPLVALIEQAQRILIFTGAGISTGSGIPDYRGPQGVWKRRQPVYYQDFLSSEKARVEYWDYKLEGWTAFREARPNAVHQAIVALERAAKLELLVTQNIDGLHSLAGTSDEKLVEIHGTNRAIDCITCGERSEPGPHFEAFESSRTPPLCKCGGLLKPATISFGQQLDNAELRRASDGANAADLAISLGSSLTVNPAASVPLASAQRGAPYVVINQGETDHDNIPQLTLRVEGDVNAIFPAAVAKVCGALDEG